MRSKARRWRVMLAFLCGLSLYSGMSATAQELDATPEAGSTPFVAPEFSIYPIGDYEHRYFEVIIEPGSTAELIAGIRNSGQMPVSLETFASNAINPPNGGFGASPEGDEPSGPTLWLEYQAEVLSLAPSEVREQRFTVTVPADTPAGEYTVALVAQTSDSLEIPGSEMFRQIIRNSVSVEIAVPGEMSSGFELGEPVITSSGAQWMMDVPITNTGTARVRPQGELTVTTEEGETVVTSQVEMGSVYGGNTTSVRVSLPEQLPVGNYYVLLNLRDEPTGASASLEDTLVTLVEPNEASIFLVDEAAVTPSGEPVQYADVAATITNNGSAIPTANVTLNVQRDGEEVESYPLAEGKALPTGSTDFSQRYIPVDGWQPGTWTFQLEISAVSGDTETILATVDIEDEIVIG